MTRYEECKAGEKEKRRIEGTTMGKEAVRQFAKGLKLRMSSPFEKCSKAGWSQHSAAFAAFHFFKWLAEIPGYGARKDESAVILVAWKSKYFKGMKWIGNVHNVDGTCTGMFPYREIIFQLFEGLEDQVQDMKSQRKKAESA